MVNDEATLMRWLLLTVKGVHTRKIPRRSEESVEGGMPLVSFAKPSVI
jgi:hypothetical protein